MNMLDRFFDALLRIHPAIRKIMGVLYVTLIVALYVVADAWLTAKFPRFPFLSF